MVMQTQEAPRRVESTIAEFPLTFGVVGAAFAPVLAAAGAIAALVTDCTIEIERTQPCSLDQL
jgi:hypothetical protein